MHIGSGTTIKLSLLKEEYDRLLVFLCSDENMIHLKDIKESGDVEGSINVFNSRAEVLTDKSGVYINEVHIALQTFTPNGQRAFVTVVGDQPEVFVSVLQKLFNFLAKTVQK